MNVFCTINYKNYAITANYIDSYIDLNESNSCLIVVDNISDATKLATLRVKYQTIDNIYFVSSEFNLGYFGGGFVGLKYYLDNISNQYPDYFCITNNDITFNKDDKWESELNRLNLKYRKLGCVGPKVEVVSSGLNQNPFLVKRPNLSHYLKWRLVFSNYYITKFVYALRSLLPSKKAIKNNQNPEDQKVYATQGAFFIFTKRFLESNYRHDLTPFLYCEEISVAEHCLNNDLDIINTPKLTVFHDEHATTTSSMNYFKYEKISEAQKFIIKEYYL